MQNKYRPISENPIKSTHYLVKFFNPNKHPTDRVETAWRYYKGNGIWERPFYNFEGDGYELIEWYNPDY